MSSIFSKVLAFIEVNCSHRTTKYKLEIAGSIILMLPQKDISALNDDTLKKYFIKAVKNIDRDTGEPIGKKPPLDGTRLPGDDYEELIEEIDDIDLNAEEADEVENKILNYIDLNDKEIDEDENEISTELSIEIKKLNENLDIIINEIEKSDLPFLEKESMLSFYDKARDSFVLKNFTTTGKSRLLSEAHKKILTIPRLKNY